MIARSLCHWVLLSQGYPQHFRECKGFSLSLGDRQVSKMELSDVGPPSDDDIPPHVHEFFERALRDRPGFEQQLHRHFEERDVTAEAYSRKRRLELGADILRKVRIYLDQRFWIFCRDAMLGSPAQPIHLKIFELLCELVDQGKAVCPVSYPVLSETFKQGDKQRRLATARCVDRLCRGVAIQPFATLIEAELLRLFMARSDPKRKLYPLKQMVWNYASWVVGEVTPKSTFFDEQTSDALAKGLYDIMAIVPFEHLVESVPGLPPELPIDERTWATEANAGATQHQHEVTSFETVLLSEIAGALDSTDATFQRVNRWMYKDATGHEAPPINSPEVREGARISRNLVYHAFRLGKITTDLPFFHIVSGIYAALRYRQQPFKHGDLWDMKHAHSALGYCDAFFTERSMGNLICQSPLRYDQTYNCRVLWDETKVLEYLQTVREGLPPSTDRV